MCDTLKKGEKVNFKIELKDDSNVEEVLILEGNNITKLNKEDKTYSNEVMITGCSDNVKIVYREIGGDTYKTFNTYKIKKWVYNFVYNFNL